LDIKKKIVLHSAGAGATIIAALLYLIVSNVCGHTVFQAVFYQRNCLTQAHYSTVCEEKVNSILNLCAETEIKDISIHKKTIKC
jgi:hypothetical protein